MSPRSRRRALVAAIALLCCDVLLFYTLVLNEAYLEKDQDAWIDTGIILAVPLLLGLACALVAIRRPRRD